MERTIDDCKVMVKEFFATIGMDANEQRLAEEGRNGWWAMRGSAQVTVQREAHTSTGAGSPFR